MSIATISLEFIQNDYFIIQKFSERSDEHREPRYGEAQSWRAFSKLGSPFHLFYPAEIVYNEKKYLSAGHCFTLVLASK